MWQEPQRKGKRRNTGNANGGGPKRASRNDRRQAVQAERQQIKDLDEKLKTRLDLSDLKTFADFPLSDRTKQGLERAGYVKPTAIQREAVARGLEGCDVLGAAKTGSGKTLAFIIPIIEKLFRLSWTRDDGVGAIVISPTRELALQTYQCLTKVGCKHDMSAGLLIGGTTFEAEQTAVLTTNIIICTPGRLLQHMDETPNFHCQAVQILALDEADRILDLGFEKTMNAIIANLPTERQTLLFSATQTKSVRDLARLSLESPEYIAVHDKAKTATPDQLVQAYVECPLPKKLDVLYSFIRTHLKCKTIVFLSSCKQVRFVYETFRRLRPGIPLLALYGKQKQVKRVAIFNDFSKKQAAVLFATDIAQRGLDIPAVDWVFQLDCPDDADTYLHRVGRTARYERSGKALLVLMPSELAMVDVLQERKVPLTKTEINTSKIESITGKLQGLCAEIPDIKYLAQKSFISYTRSVFLQSNKKVFDVHALPLENYALSLGLPNSPRIRFVHKDKQQKEQARKNAQAESESESDSEPDEPKPVVTRFERLQKKKNQDVMSAAREKIRLQEDDDEDELLRPANKQLHDTLEDDDEPPEMGPTSKKKRRALKTKIGIRKSVDERGHYTEFDEEGNQIRSYERLAGISVNEHADKAKASLEQEGDIKAAAAKNMATEDAVDRVVQREKLRARRRELKAKVRAALQAEQDGDDGPVAVLGSAGGPYSDEEDDEQGGFESEDDDQEANEFHRKRSLREDYEEDSDDEEEQPEMQQSKSRKSKRAKPSLAEDEELALRLLSG